MALPERNERIGRLHPGIQHVQRELRSRNVGDRHIERPCVCRQPGAERNQSCGRSGGHPNERRSTEGLVRLLESLSLSAHRSEARNRVWFADRERSEPHRHLIPKSAALVHAANTDRGHHAEVDPIDLGRVDAALVPEERAHSTGHGGEEHVVDRPAKLVLDCLHIGEGHVDPRESPPRTDISVDRSLAGRDQPTGGERRTHGLQSVGDRIDEI